MALVDDRKYLSCGFNQSGVFLDLGGNAHIDVFVTDGHNQTSQQSGVNGGLQENCFVGLDEFLKE